MTFTTTMQNIGNGIDALGVLVIIFGLIITTLYFIKHIFKQTMENAYTRYRQSLARVILLGLEFLIAGDIVRTVAVTPTLISIAILGGIVIIRTFLSTTLQLEVEGHWPWQRKN